MAEQVTVRVDRAACAGTGLCASMSPDLFRMDDDGLAEARLTVLRSPEQIDAAGSVRDCCPTEAVLLGTADDQEDQ